MKQETKPLDKMSDTELTNFWNKNAEKNFTWTKNC